MVSLDHTIYFHNPKGFRADDWLLTEMESPWSGDGRGLVFQRIYSQNGLLIATCVQEVSLLYAIDSRARQKLTIDMQGVVRLKQKPESKI